MELYFNLIYNIFNLHKDCNPTSTSRFNWDKNKEQVPDTQSVVAFATLPNNFDDSRVR